MSDKYVSSDDTILVGGPDKMSTFAKWAFGLVGGCAVGITVAAFPFISPAFRRHCLPFIPATEKQVKQSGFKKINMSKYEIFRPFKVESVITALRWCSNDSNNKLRKIVDLGSGDGRIVWLYKQAATQ